ncbi:MAG: hypothetical protein JW946_05455, partial [Candidatus Omnitrophica bacterium]|nr:hypothetical protein [Candidatus Omnitrophota bacterium]
MSKKAANLCLFILVLFVVCPVLCELFIRAGIFFNVKSFRNPALYADCYSDDNYWKLQHTWQGQWKFPGKDLIDPILGWIPKPGKNNSLGIIIDPARSINFLGKTVLCYGDSFIAGNTEIKDRIPQKLQELLPDCNVYNLGVGGYGLDQIFLRFKNTHAYFRQPVVVIGILTTDLDRSILTIRTGPKPYFTIKEGMLVLKGIPVAQDPEAWLKNHPPRIKSYFFAFINRLRWIIRAKGNKREFIYLQGLAYKQKQKKEINRLILKSIAKEARKNNLKLLFVIFYDAEELHKNDWRSVFLKEEFTGLRTDFLDIKDVLLKDSMNTSSSTSSYYLEEGHLNEKGNRVVAR